MKRILLAAASLLLAFGAKAQVMDLHLMNNTCANLEFVITTSAANSCSSVGNESAIYQIPGGSNAYIDLDIYGTNYPPVNWNSTPPSGVTIYSVSVYEVGNPAGAKTVYHRCTGRFTNWQPLSVTCGSGYVVGADTPPSGTNFSVDVH